MPGSTPWARSRVAQVEGVSPPSINDAPGACPYDRYVRTFATRGTAAWESVDPVCRRPAFTSFGESVARHRGS